MKRAAWVALLTIVSFAAVAMAQSGGSTGGATTSMSGGGSGAPASTTSQPGTTTGPTNPAMGSNTLPGGGSDIGTQGLNPSNVNDVNNAMSNEANVPANTTQSTLPSPTTTTVTNGGFVGGTGAFAPLVGTPSASIGGNASPSPVGATNAPAGLQAGATSSALGQVPPTGSVMSQDVLTYNPGSVAMPMNASGGAPNLASNAGNGSVFNTGAAQFEAAQGLNGQSLGQIARERRQKKGTENVRVYTNQDLERLAQAPNTGLETNGITGQGANSYMTGAQATRNQASAPAATGGTTGVLGSTAIGAQPQNTPAAVGAPAQRPPHNAAPAQNNPNNPPPTSPH